MPVCVGEDMLVCESGWGFYNNSNLIDSFPVVCLKETVAKFRSGFVAVLGLESFHFHLLLDINPDRAINLMQETGFRHWK